MKLTHTKEVTVTLTLNEKEAEARAQLCARVGGKECLRLDFYHDVWRQIRGALGVIPDDSGAWHSGADTILCTGFDGPRIMIGEAGGSQRQGNEPKPENNP